jgi:hypothetical protein
MKLLVLAAANRRHFDGGMSVIGHRQAGQWLPPPSEILQVLQLCTIKPEIFLMMKSVSTLDMLSVENGQRTDDPRQGRHDICGKQGCSLQEIHPMISSNVTDNGEAPYRATQGNN